MLWKHRCICHVLRSPLAGSCCTGAFPPRIHWSLGEMAAPTPRQSPRTDWAHNYPHGTHSETRPPSSSSRDHPERGFLSVNMVNSLQQPGSCYVLQGAIQSPILEPEQFWFWFGQFSWDGFACLFRWCGLFWEAMWPGGCW